MCVSERYLGKMTNPYTLNHLYFQGILDYVPYDLCGGAVVSPMNAMQNPYLNAAQQGALYQNNGKYSDFVEIGLGNNIGVNSNAGSNAYGLQDIGLESNAGANAYGLSGVGTQSQTGGINAWGGMSDVQNGIAKTTAFFDSIPKFVKGLVAGTLMIGSLALVFKSGKKPTPTNNTSFLSKLKPTNWFKKKTV